MKYIFVFLTFVISLNSIAQSKKEQIAILTARLDSLNKEYVKDTTYLSNTVETIDREYTIMTMQYDEAQEQLKKKSATITDKSNTIKSLNAKNMGFMTELKVMRESLNSMDLENRKIKKSLDSLKMSLTSEFFFVARMSNKSEPPSTRISFLADYEIELYRGNTIIAVFNDSGEGWLNDEKNIFYLNTSAGGDRTYSIQIINNKEVIVNRDFNISGNLIENWHKTYQIDECNWELESQFVKCWDFEGNEIKCD